MKLTCLTAGGRMDRQAWCHRQKCIVPGCLVEYRIEQEGKECGCYSLFVEKKKQMRWSRYLIRVPSFGGVPGTFKREERLIWGFIYLIRSGNTLGYWDPLEGTGNMDVKKQQLFIKETNWLFALWSFVETILVFEELQCELATGGCERVHWPYITVNMWNFFFF